MLMTGSILNAIGILVGGLLGLMMGRQFTAATQLAWRGLRSRPAWRILLYSADEPPSVRGLVELDAVDGHVLGEYTEDNPEDWSQFGLDGTAQP